jgi:hypothetical protein
MALSNSMLSDHLTQEQLDQNSLQEMFHEIL